ncbi:rubrerythrin family protein [candidate division KSB1 bacterium]|nr:rubrerythrin family protein [candidate division KSB1 bacterium]
MKKMTEKSLNEAMAGESMAHVKYLAFSDVAEREGFSNVARLFKAISYAEQVHATNHARNLGYINKTAENLQEAIDGETFEVDEMYAAYDAIAKLQGEKAAEKSIYFAREAEKIHAKMYADAKAKVDTGSDIDIDTVYICPVCGFTHIGEPPANCPVCNVSKDKFVAFAK